MSERVYLGNTSARPSQSVTRPNNATAYAAGDVIGTATTHVLDFSDVGKLAGGSGLLAGALLIDSANQATAPSLELWLFSAAPAAQVDNVAFAPTDVELANLVGVIPLTTARVGDATAGAAGNLVIQSDIASLIYKCAPGTTHLYGVLVVRNAYAPVANEVFTVVLSVLQDVARAA
jgi:hypothetical protein